MGDGDRLDLKLLLFATTECMGLDTGAGDADFTGLLTLTGLAGLLREDGEFTWAWLAGGVALNGEPRDGLPPKYVFFGDASF